MDEKRIKNNLRSLSIIFAAICLLVILGARIASNALNEAYESSLDQQFIEKAQQYTIIFNKQTDADFQTLQALASFFTHNNTIDMEQLARGLSASNSRTQYLGMGFFPQDGNGILVTSEGRLDADIPLSSICSEVQAAIEAALEGNNTMAKVYYEERLEKNMVAYAVPVYGGDSVIGALFAVQDAAVLTKTLTDVEAVSENGVIAVISEHSDILMASVSHETRDLASMEVTSSFSPEVLERIHEMAHSYTPDVFRFEANGISYRAATYPLSIYTSKILVIDTSDAIPHPTDTTHSVTQVAVFVILGLTALFVVIAYYKIYRHHTKLITIAYRDRLTGAYNMEKFHELLTGMQRENSAYSIVAINIRQFKFINEIFGPQQSNLLLCSLKNIIEKNLHDGEFFCRESADAFFLLMRDTNQDVVRQRLDQLFTEIDQATQAMHPGYPIYFYCGIASTLECNDISEDPTELMTHVMFALDRAKLSQQNSIWFYDMELHKKEQLLNFIESNMQKALAHREFKVYLQPKMDLKTGKLASAEALVRWISEGNRIIFPDQFIPLFEQNSFCIQLDLYMIEEVCRLLRSWIDAGITPIPISVNQTKLLFYKEGYVEQLTEITSRYGISPHLITLEILEGLALKDVKKLNHCIHSLQEKGFRISMDDFGSGYSSLNTVGNITIDELKLERTFLLAAASDETGRQKIVMEQVITMAKRLSITTVAEGVETEKDALLMRELHCDYGQGYYYSRPIPADDFLEKFMKHPG